MIQTTGVIVEALNFNSTKHDSKTLTAAVEQDERLADRKVKSIFVDSGYSGTNQIKET